MTTTITTTMTVSSGSTVSGADIAAGGLVEVLAGGGGALDGVAENNSITSGGELLQDGGVVIGNVVSSFGLLAVAAGQVIGTIISAGGTETVSSGGSEAGAQVLSGGTENVLAGGAVQGIVVAASGQESVAGLESGSKVSGTGAVQTILAGGVASQTVIVSGGAQVVSSGGAVVSAVVSAGGSQVLGGGVADATVVSTGGVQSVASDGLALNTQVTAGGSVTVQSGGFIADASISGGEATVQSGGIARGNLVISGGTEALFGAQTGAGIANGGLVDVQSGGVDSAALIGAGGQDVVLNHGTAQATTVNGGKLLVGSGGLVSGATIAGGVLEIASGGIVSGVISFAGGSGATLQIDGNGAFGGAVANMVIGQTIDFTTLAFVSGGSTALSGGVLSVTEGAVTDTLTFSTAAAPTFTLSKDAGSGTLLVEVACFAAGTRIATPCGDVAAEALAAGDEVLALQDGEWRPARVRWVGRSTIDLARHPQPHRAAPIRIRAGGIAEGVPARDLLVSPDHAIFLDGVLIQAQALLNGASVVQEFPRHIDYVHVELDRHAVLCAEGLAAESYLDTGNRAIFAGAAGVRPLHADLAGAAAWDERACAPLLLGGARVASAHARVLARAEALGWATDQDAGLRVIQEGTTARLVSRSFVPAWLGLGADRRRLGVAVASLRLDGRKLPRRAFGQGWHAAEPGWRWTDGAAVLHLPRPGRLTLRLAPVAARYWTAPVLADHAAAG